jgi:hypothetical protein
VGVVWMTMTGEARVPPPETIPSETAAKHGELPPSLTRTDDNKKWMMNDSLIAGKDFIAARKSESGDQYEVQF